MAELYKADPSHLLSSHLRDRFQMTGPQDRPIWCGMTDFLFFQFGWEKTVQKRNVGIQNNCLWFRLLKECPVPMFPAFPWSLLLPACLCPHLLCPFLPLLCTLLPWPHHHFASTHSLLSHLASSPLHPDLLYFVCSVSKTNQHFHSANKLPFYFFFFPSQLLSLFFPIPIQILPSPTVSVSSLKCTKGVSGTTKSSLQLSTLSPWCFLPRMDPFSDCLYALPRAFYDK